MMNDVSAHSPVREVPAKQPAGRAIAHVAEANTLTSAQMRDRAIIERGQVARPEVDAFREIRTRLLAAANGNFVTLVVPVSAGSGGSFVARNLAAAFAFDETKSSLLIDCDLRYPSQHTVMHIDPVHGGLVDYLDDEDHDLASVIYPTGVARLRVMPAGTPHEMGSEYFSSQRMRLLIDSLRSRYSDRYMILDGPSVRGNPDARILADLADLVVLVAGYGRDTPASIAQAAANFDPGKFAGVVFNEGA